MYCELAFAACLAVMVGGLAWMGSHVVREIREDSQAAYDRRYEKECELRSQARPENAPCMLTDPCQQH